MGRKVEPTYVCLSINNSYFPTVTVLLFLHVVSQQIRGFKTKRSTSKIGIGSHSPEETYTPLRGFKDAVRNPHLVTGLLTFPNEITILVLVVSAGFYKLFCCHEKRSYMFGFLNLKSITDLKMVLYIMILKRHIYHQWVSYFCFPRAAWLQTQSLFFWHVDTLYFPLPDIVPD